MPPLLLWLLAAASAEAPPSLPLASGRSLPLEVRVEVASLEERRRFPPLAWRAEGGALVGTADDRRCAATVRLWPAEGGVQLEVSLRYDGAASVEREVVRLRLPGRAPRAVGHDLVLRPLRAALRVDRGTPVFLATSEAALAGGAGLVAVRYQPDRGGVEVELILDDDDARPFALYERCLDRLPGLSQPGPMTFGSLEKRHPLGPIRRRPGDALTARAALFPLRPGGEVLPLLPERWAAGARAAVVFTDHADRTDPLALRAVLQGDSRGLCREGAPLGFLGHGIRLTKSFFVHAKLGGLDDPETAALAEELRAAGCEVASHSPSGEPDDREAVRAALPVLSRFGAVTWIDHEPYTNCEALSSQGWQDSGRYGIRDLLAEAGFRWIWQAGDVGGFGADPRLVDVLAPGDLVRGGPPIYPLPVDQRLWAFRSSMFYAPPARLAAALEELPLLRLEAGRGLFVAHTYLSASPRTTARAEQREKLAVRETGDGGLELDPALDAALSRLAEHVRMGRLATLTWAEAGERLRALSELEVTYLADGSAEVSNRGSRPLPGLTLAVPAGGLELSVEGAEVQGMDGDAERARVWFDLPAGASAVVRAEQHGLPVPFLPGAPGLAGAP
ncbi:MAG TPA: hypothetical protein VFR85_08105 [Anaeromyxobacteraceae bacterium]|nr:hypothetical protein [Anaeromyxobacteraceae bacterium]